MSDAERTHSKHTADLHRLLRIITLVQADPRWGPKRLTAELGVTERTVYRDIYKLKAVGVPIRYDRRARGYRINGEFFLQPLQLTAEESLALAALCGEVAEREQIAFLRPAFRALAKIEAQLPAGVREEVAGISDHVVIQTARAAPPDGYIDVYDRIRVAIARRQDLECEYESAGASGSTEPFTFRPYVLFYGVRAWYSVGWHGGHGEVRCLKLNRFTRITQTERTYSIPPGFSLEAHLGNAWRMIRGDRDFNVELLIDAQFAETVSDTIWHRTQQTEFHSDGSVTLRFTISGLDEIIWWILSLGPHCRVIRPDALIKRIREASREVVALYAKGG